jgi:hypothetical protein
MTNQTVPGDAEPHETLDQTPDQTIDPESIDEGPGCMPAIMASVVLMGIIGFVTCSISTWWLFQQRSEMALRTVRGDVIPKVEQGLLRPETKAQVVDELSSFADDLERGEFENWQAAGAMTRLIRVPIYQWGEIQAIEAFLEKNQDESYSDSIKQLSRLQRAVQMGQAVAIDFEDVLEPARVADPSGPTGFALRQPLDLETIAKVVLRAKLVADRSEVPDERFENIHLESIVRDEIKQGISIGK